MSQLKERAQKLGLHAIVSEWDHYVGQDWLEGLIAAEEKERGRRSLETRFREAKLGHFKSMTDFSWDWPERIDREQVEELFKPRIFKRQIKCHFNWHERPGQNDDCAESRQHSFAARGQNKVHQDKRDAQ